MLNYVGEPFYNYNTAYFEGADATTSPPKNQGEGIINYTLQANPKGVLVFIKKNKDLLQKANEGVNQNPKAACLEIIKKKGHQGIIEFLKHHPDQELILEAFAQKLKKSPESSSSKHPKNCGCKTCKEKDKAKRRKVIYALIIISLLSLIAFGVTILAIKK